MEGEEEEGVFVICPEIRISLEMACVKYFVPKLYFVLQSYLRLWEGATPSPKTMRH